MDRFSGSHALQEKTNTHHRPLSLYLPSKKFKTVLANHKLTASREAYHFWILKLKTSSSEDVTNSLRFTAARMTLSNGQTRSHKGRRSRTEYLTRSEQRYFHTIENWSRLKIFLISAYLRPLHLFSPRSYSHGMINTWLLSTVSIHYKANRWREYTNLSVGGC